jgi:hypothetical protein
METMGEMITMRFRSEDQLANIPSDIRSSVGLYIDQAKSGMVEISVGSRLRGGPRERFKRHENIKRKFPTDKEFQLPVRAALLLLNRYPYSLLFDEVDDGEDFELSDDVPNLPPAPRRRKG